MDKKSRQKNFGRNIWVNINLVAIITYVFFNTPQQFLWPKPIFKLKKVRRVSSKIVFKKMVGKIGSKKKIGRKNELFFFFFKEKSVSYSFY